jgi:hypothetical protein
LGLDWDKHELELVRGLDLTRRTTFDTITAHVRLAPWHAVMQTLGPDRTVMVMWWTAPGETRKPARIVLDNGPVHTSKATVAALAQRSHWLTPEWLAKYAPELNDIERSWQTLKGQHLAHRTFTDTDHLVATIHRELKTMNANKSNNPLVNQRISVRLITGGASHFSTPSGTSPRGRHVK